MIRNLTSPGTYRSSRITEPGFTLLEVLVAVAITSIIVAALYSAFFLSRRAVDAVDESLLRLQESRAVLDIMKKEIESVLYRPERPYTVFKLDDRDFYGKQASQILLTSFSSVLPGLAKITYSVEEREGKLVLRKKISSAFSQAGETTGTEMMENIESFTVEAGYNGKWVRTWDSGVVRGIPDEIRISLKIYTRKDESPVTLSEIARPRTGRPL